MRTTLAPILVVMLCLAGCGRPTESSESAGQDAYSTDQLGTVTSSDSDRSGPEVTDLDDHVAVPPAEADHGEMGGSGANIAAGANDMSEDPIPTPPKTTVHTAAKGDTFWNLAVKYYGDGKQWKRIARANPDVKMNSIPVGAKIVIPRD